MRRVLGHREFRLLWLSQVGSTMADRLVIAVQLVLVFAPPVRAVRQPNSGTPLSGVEASA